MANTIDFSDLIPQSAPTAAAAPGASAAPQQPAAIDFSDLIPKQASTSSNVWDEAPGQQQFDQNGNPLSAFNPNLTFTSEANAFPGRVADFSRGAMSAIPFSDRARAGVETLGGGSYADNLNATHAADAFSRNRDPAAFFMGNAASTFGLPMGFMGRGAAAAEGGVDAYEAANAATQAAPLGSKIVGGAAAGSAIGAAQGASSSPDLTNMDQTLPMLARGAAYGAGFGAGLPVAGAIAGGAVRAAAPFFADRPDGMSRTVFGLLGNSTRPGALDTLNTLGPDAMLADASPSLTGLAQGAAGKDSAARDLLVQELQNRDIGTSARLMADRYAQFGHAMSPDQAKAAMGSRMDATGPMYAEALANAGPIDVRPVSNDIEGRYMSAANGGKTQAAMSQFGDLLAGPQVRGMPTLENDPNILQNAKGEMDDAITALKEKAGTSASNRALAAMTGVRTNLNDVMTNQIPGFADANLAYGTAARGLDGFNRGRDMLGNGDIWAPDHAAAFGQLPLEQQALERAGHRSTIEQIALDSPNDLVSQRRALGDVFDTKRGKSETYFGQEPTQNYVDSLNRNAQFRNTFQQVSAGSKTQPATASANLVNTTFDPPPSFGGNENYTATALRYGQQAARAGFRALAGISPDAQRLELARALSAIGPERDAIVNPLAEALRTWDSAGASTNRAVSNPVALGAALSSMRDPEEHVIEVRRSRRVGQTQSR